LAMLGLKKSILVLVFLMAGAYFSFTPSHAEENGEATAQRARGNRGNATFTHKRAEHAKISCNVCHNVTPQRIEVTSFPGHSTCIGCHNFANEFFGRGLAFCGVCHSGGPTSSARSALFDFKEKTRRLHSVSGSDFGIDFSHPTHRKPLPQDFLVHSPGKDPFGQTPLKLSAGQGARCTDCHQRIETASAGQNELTIEKGHSTCFQCHGMRPANNPRPDFPYMNDCRQCHEVGGPKATHLVNIREFSHADHDYDIRPRKKIEYRVKRPADFLCAECHKSVETAEKLTDIRMPDDSSCATCHNGRIGLPDALARDVLDKLR
jgi:hypothetical protein